MPKDFDSLINARVAHHTRDLKPERVTRERTEWCAYLETLASEVNNVERPDLFNGSKSLGAHEPHPARSDAVSRMLHVHYHHDSVRGMLTHLAQVARNGTFTNSVPIPGCPTLSVVLRAGCPVYAVVLAKTGDWRLEQAWQALADLGLEPSVWESLDYEHQGILVHPRIP